MALAMVLGIVLPLAAQLWDKSQMDAAMRERTWNVATWGAALYAFGPLSMLGWMWVTRPRWLRAFFGAAATAVVLAAVEVGDVVFVTLFSHAPKAEELRDELLGMGIAASAFAVLLLVFEIVVSLRRWANR